ncbi:RNA polymerase sigma factor SigZ [Bremerella sp. JC770]|uniref:RNA polymerase sigma factor SigZ n=1 Tax=Bremerella sp. JC770 TaxID=3232137 RepID=UPI0034575AE0
MSFTLRTLEIYHGSDRRFRIAQINEKQIRSIVGEEMREGCRTTEDIWQQMGKQLKLFFVARVRDHQTAEDLLQEVFLRIHAKLETVSDQQRIEPWIFQIARNLLADHYRFRSRETVPLVEHPEASLENEEQLKNVVIGWLPQMLIHLPPKYRTALELYELQGKSQQEIADQLNISLSGAKSRVQRGRTKLKEVLFDCCSFEHDRCGNLIGYSRNKVSKHKFDRDFAD